MKALAVVFFTFRSVVCLKFLQATTLGPDPQTVNRLNGESFQQDPLVTFNGESWSAKTKRGVLSEEYTTLRIVVAATGIEFLTRCFWLFLAICSCSFSSPSSLFDAHDILSYSLALLHCCYIFQVGSKTSCYVSWAISIEIESKVSNPAGPKDLLLPKAVVRCFWIDQ